MDENNDSADISDLRRLRKRVPDNWALCEFLGSCEAEMIIAQTIHAACRNYDQCAEAYSIRGPACLSVFGGGLIDNATAYHRLIEGGLLIEARRGGNVVLFPTKKLVERLDCFLSNREPALPAKEEGDVSRIAYRGFVT